MGLIRVILRLFGRRNEPARPDPMGEVDADLMRQEPAYEPAALPPSIKAANEAINAGAEPVSDRDELPAQRKAKPGTLAAIIGFAAAAIALTIVPKDESGRTVDVTIADDGAATINHVRGPQYLRAYFDVAGIATACDGIIRVDGRPVRIGDVFTEERCTELLERELRIHAEGMMRCTPAFRNHPDKEAIGPTLAAVTSFTYNVGVGGYCGSTAARRFNAGDWRGGCDAMMMWNKARVGGVLQPVRGLTLRRERERALCLTGL